MAQRETLDVKKCVLCMLLTILIGSIIFVICEIEMEKPAKETHYVLGILLGLLVLDIILILSYNIRLRACVHKYCSNCDQYEPEPPPVPPPVPPRRQVNFDQYFQGYIQSDDMCVICHKDGGERAILPCQHHFHPECITEWFRRKIECPVCRRDPIAIFAAMELWAEIENMHQRHTQVSIV